MPGRPRSRSHLSRNSSRLRILVLSGALSIFILYSLLPRSTPLFSRDTAHKIQFDFSRHAGNGGDPAKAAAVKETMKDTFWTYRRAAWGMDEVRPLSGGNRTSRNGWAATIVDTLTTMAVMGLEEEFKLSLGYVVNDLNFDNAVDLVDPFETTIRYLGSLVSTVELLDAGILKVSKAERDGVLKKAVHLAGKLGPGFDSPTGMIWPRINFTQGIGCREVEGERPYPDYDHATIGPARAGSNWLENYGLSRLTGDPIYLKNATNAWKPLVYNKWVEEWPGIIDAPWDIMTGTPYDTHRSWGAGHDSYYEYLIKAHVLSPRDPHSAKYRDRWVQAVESTRDNLLFRSIPPSQTSPPGPLFLHQWRNGWLLNEMGHLACFAGGNMLLGGAYLSRPDISKLGEELVSTCRRVYAATQTQIGPEYFQWEPKGRDLAYRPEQPNQREQLKDVGWWITDARWMLRPETVESYFYAYRITGEKKYQTWAWEAYQAYMKASKAKYGYAEVQDVTQPPGEGNQADKAESFWGAETLKYLYLIFADASVLSLDEWVFSTEAHPFAIKEKTL